MSNLHVKKDVEWLLKDFQYRNMSENDLKKDYKSESLISSSRSSGLFSSLTTSHFPRNNDPLFKVKTLEDYYSEKADYGFFENFNKDNIKLIPGSIVVVQLGFFLDHTGIYVGDGKFIELYGDGTINLISKEDFLHGAYKNDFPARTGVNIYVATIDGKPILLKEAKERAIYLYENVKKIEYDIIRNNCHMFTGFCVFGKNFQKNNGCKFFTNLTRLIIDNFSKNTDEEYKDIWSFVGSSSEVFRSAPKYIDRFSWRIAKL